MSLNLQKIPEIKLQKNGLLDKLLKTFIIDSKAGTSPSENLNEKGDLLESISIAKKDWACANINFEYAYDEQEIDYYAYKIKACEIRYEYLIKKAKEKGIRIELPDSSAGFVG